MVKNAYGVGKTIKMVTNFAKMAAKTAANAVLLAANKGAITSGKTSSSKYMMNMKARKAAKKALKKVRNAA